MQFQFTQKQIIFLVIAGVAALIVVLMFVGIIPGRRMSSTPITTLEFWGVDRRDVWEGTIARFQAVYPVKISYKQIDESSYETDVIKALAAGKGPDIFMFDNNWLLEHRDKIVPVSQEKLSAATLQTLFPQAIEQDFVLDGRIYALPLYLDTLVLAYNRDHFDQAAIASPPTTWAELDKEIPLLKKSGATGDLTRPAFAIGGSSSNVQNAIDLLNLFLMQSGVKMIDDDQANVLFGTWVGREAFGRYISYAKPDSAVYTWNNNLKGDLELFAKGDIAGVFVYSKQLKDIESRNSLLNMGISTMPQVNLETAINYPNYYGLAVLSRTASPNAAWDFVTFATTDRDSAIAYAQATDLPPALRFLIDERKNNSGRGGIMAKQALTARSWLQPDSQLLDKAFNEAIVTAEGGQFTIEQVFGKMFTTVNDLLITQR